MTPRCPFFRWGIPFLLPILVLIATGRGLVDGFAIPGRTNIGAGAGASRNRFGKNDSGGIGRTTIRPSFANHHPKQITKKAGTTNTQLGLKLALPMPNSPRLTGHVIEIAESWAPVVGVITATLLYLAPAKAVWKAIRRGRNAQRVSKIVDEKDNPLNQDYYDTLYGLNPLPIAIMPFVAVSWLAYGLTTSDTYLIMGNLPGTMFSVAYLIGILPLMNYNASRMPTLKDIGNEIKITNQKPTNSKRLILIQATVLLSLTATLSLWGTIGVFTAYATDGFLNVGGLTFGMGWSSMLRNGVVAEALGVYAASLFIVLSGSPLFSIRTILKTKNSDLILGRLAAAQVVNTGLWTAYGLAVRDHFVWGPNIIALCLGLMQLALKILYPSKNEGRRQEV